MQTVWKSNLLAISMLQLILKKKIVTFEKLKFYKIWPMVLFRTVVKPNSSELDNSTDYQKCVTKMNIIQLLTIEAVDMM